MKFKPLTTRRFDSSTHSIWRTLIQDLRFRVIPLGNYYGGPNLFFILRLLTAHYGRPPIVHFPLRFYRIALTTGWRDPKTL